MALLAGAKVYAVGRDSLYGKYDDVSRHVRKLCERIVPTGVIDFARKDEFANWSDGDIVTNAGMLRPLSARIVRELKSTAVIPLMWETWEFRPEDLDLPECQQCGIPVIGTNEHYPLCDMYGYPGMLALHVLFSLGIEGANNRLALLGGGLTGKLIAETFSRLGFDHWWFTSTGEDRPDRCFAYARLRDLLELEDIDAVICAEHRDHRLLLGRGAALTFSELRHRFPHLRWGHISGRVDVGDLRDSGLLYMPEAIAPPGHMSYHTDWLGPRPAIELSAAGLKVGEITARARLAGASPTEAIRIAVDHGIGMDFEGGFLNYRHEARGTG